MQHVTLFRLSCLQALFLLLLLAVSLTFATTPTLAQEAPEFDPTEIPVPVQPPTSGLGAATYQENCAPCHGETGASDGPVVGDLPAPPPAFADPATTWEVSPAETFHVTKVGRVEQLMPPWGNQLSDDEIWDVVYYARTLHTDETNVQEGAALYDDACAACHGPEGAGDGPDAEGDLGDLSDSAAMIFRSPADVRAGWESAHPDLGAGWSESQQRNVVDYISTLSYIPPWGSPYRAGDGVISGRIIQGTAGGAAVEGIPVRLRAFINFADAASFETTTDAEGNFRFDGLMADPSVVYLAESTIDDIRYSSDFFEFAPDSVEATTEFTVYATGSDGSGLTVPRANWVIDFDPGALVIGQIYTFGNQDDRTFTGRDVPGLDRPVTLAVPIPAGVEQIEFPDGVLGEEYLELDGIIYDTRPVIPGEQTRQFFVSYRLPVESDSARVTFPIDRELPALNLLVADLPDVEIEVDALTFIADETIQGMTYRLWGGENIAPGAVEVALEGVLEAGAVDPRALADPAVEGSASTPNAAVRTEEPLDNRIIFGLGGLLLIALAGVFVWSARSSGSDASTDLKQERKSLLHEIAALDDSHAAGDLSDDVWAAERARLKTRLLVVTSTLQQDGE